MLEFVCSCLCALWFALREDGGGCVSDQIKPLLLNLSFHLVCFLIVCLFVLNCAIVVVMSDSEEEIQERQLKIVLLGDGASGKVLPMYHSKHKIHHSKLKTILHRSTIVNVT